MTNDEIQFRRLKELAIASDYDLKMTMYRYRSALERGIKQLTELERSVIVQRFIRDKTIAQVAEWVGVSWNGADALIDRSVAKLRMILDKESIELIDKFEK
jgi:DNA-directed RNA polymerase specialized sigma24 family protein